MSHKRLFAVGSVAIAARLFLSACGAQPQVKEVKVEVTKEVVKEVVK